MENLIYVVVPFLISTISIPVIKWIGDKLNIVAEMNNRTIHTKRIVRIGGVSIYLAFIISMGLFMKVDASLNGVILGASIMFFVGLFDDMINLKPLVKFGMQMIAALVLMFVGGVTLTTIHLPFGIVITWGVLSFAVTFFWLTGITNAINLIDGLDGLAAGICMIVLAIFVPITIIENRPDVLQLCLILIGSIGGFLMFNFNPASIFMGDSGSLFLGFMVASIGLLGFKSSTIITLALPILLLTVPILDTISAVIRRFLAGVSIGQADKNHLHHVLMRKFGHRSTVLLLYAFTFALGVIAYIYIYSQPLGLTLLVIVGFGIEIFLEKSQMISPKYRPILNIIEKIKLKTSK